MTREQLIKLIHVAKSQLHFDDDLYRTTLVSLTKKNSSTKMNKAELEKVFKFFCSKGFNYTGKVINKKRTTVKISDRYTMIKKIQAIWIEMGRWRFIDDASDNALDGYVHRMTKSKVKGGIHCAAWLDNETAPLVLEPLKKWHLRVIVDFCCEQNNAFSYSDNTLRFKNYSYKGYDEVAEFFSQVMKNGAKKSPH